MSWQDEGACKGQNDKLFHPDIPCDEPNGDCAPDDGTIGPTAEYYEAGKAFCRKCPVSDTCLLYARTTRQQYGLWGGHTPLERLRLDRRDRRRRLRMRRLYEEAEDAGEFDSITGEEPESGWGSDVDFPVSSAE